MEPCPLWEILVPTVHGHVGNLPSKDKPVKLRHHKVWDAKVLEITGGLTINKPARGQWISPTGQLFLERMIPVKIRCSLREIRKIAEFTALHYAQEEVLFYKISDDSYLVRNKILHAPLA